MHFVQMWLTARYTFANRCPARHWPETLWKAPSGQYVERPLTGRDILRSSARRAAWSGYAASRFFCEIGLLEDINLKVYPSSSPLVCTCAVEVLSPSLRHTSTPILEPSVCSSQVINLKNATTKGWAAAPPTQFSNLEVKNQQSSKYAHFLLLRSNLSATQVPP
jgi:hypothetical protein